MGYPDEEKRLAEQREADKNRTQKSPENESAAEKEKRLADENRERQGRS